MRLPKIFSPVKTGSGSSDSARGAGLMGVGSSSGSQSGTQVVSGGFIYPLYLQQLGFLAPQQLIHLLYRLIGQLLQLPFGAVKVVIRA